MQQTPHLSANESAMIRLLFSLRHQGKGPCSSFCMSLRLTKDRHATEGFVSSLDIVNCRDCDFLVVRQSSVIACSGVIKLEQVATTDCLD